MTIQITTLKGKTREIAISEISVISVLDDKSYRVTLVSGNRLDVKRDIVMASLYIFLFEGTSQN